MPCFARLCSGMAAGRAYWPKWYSTRNTLAFALMLDTAHGGLWLNCRDLPGKLAGRCVGSEMIQGKVLIRSVYRPDVRMISYGKRSVAGSTNCQPDGNWDLHKVF